MKIRTLSALLFSTVILSACSGIKPYPNQETKNLHISAHTDANLFKAIDVSLNIYQVGSECQLSYEGTVKLNGASTPVGIPTNALRYLSFVFASSSLLGNSKSSITLDTLFHARPGANYDIALSYKDNIYNGRIWERQTQGSKPIDQHELKSCWHYRNAYQLEEHLQ